ncbi:hypothetical protein GGR23_003950 [Gellertiella hungarica]|uniref:DUF2155 domain-containing protein n=1 Tax=Gellertiella hungarica TaxID=1572859 RepID=A0A7W6J8J7_9HYPH|nr:hypothetical protein [Gellertiella hungarica]
MTNSKTSGWVKALPVAALAALSSAPSAEAARISNPVASFSGLDKITGRITTFDVYIGETVQFGALQVTPRACYNRDESEAQRVDAFVEVDEITLDRKIRRIFTGWMFADSPALNAIEHPIFDVWLKECKQKTDVPPPKDLKIPPSEPKAPPKPAGDQAPATDASPSPVPVDPGQPEQGQVEPQSPPPPAPGTEPPIQDVEPAPLPPLEDGATVDQLPAPPDAAIPEELPPLPEPDSGFGLPPEPVPVPDDGFVEPAPDGAFPPPPQPQPGQPGGGQGGFQ